MNFTVTEHKFSKYYNHDMSLFGAFPSSDCLRFELRIPRSFGTFYAEMQIYPDCENSVLVYIPLEWTGIDCGNDVYSLNADVSSFAEKSHLHYYRYKISGTGGEFFLGGEEPTELRECSASGDRQLLLFDPDFRTSEHLKNGLIYHIFVDRFRKSGRCSVKSDAIINTDWDNGIPQYGEYPGAPLKNNMFFGGDLYGIAEKLEYIESLGVSTIYLSPVFESASNHKYDTGDYLRVDSMFGGDDALAELIEKAAGHNIKIILDGVFNHMGSDSVYFNREGNYPPNGAYNSRQSPYFSWYSFEDYPDKYVCWWNVDILPRVDSGNRSYKDFMFSQVIPKWMKAGIFGWRLDVADELDNGFLDTLRLTARGIEPDSPIIGEVWEDATNKIAYGHRRRYFQGAQLDSVMNYPLRKAVIDYIRDGNHEELCSVSGGLYRRCPKQCSDAMMNFLSTHDTQRILTVLGGEEQGEHTNEELSTMRMSASERRNAIVMLKLAFALIAGMPGVPCIFYGDEAGLEGYRDPFCRRPFPWNNIETSLLDYYRKIGSIRKNEPLLRDGLFENVYADESLYVFKRSPFGKGTHFLLAVINRSDRALPLDFANEGEELIGDEISKRFIIEPMSAAYIKLPVRETVTSENFR